MIEAGKWYFLSVADQSDRKLKNNDSVVVATPSTDVSSACKWKAVAVGNGAFYLVNSSGERLGGGNGSTSAYMGGILSTGPELEWNVTTTGTRFFVDSNGSSKPRIRISGSTVVSMSNTSSTGGWVKWTLTITAKPFLSKNLNELHSLARKVTKLKKEIKELKERLVFFCDEAQKTIGLIGSHGDLVDVYYGTDTETSLVTLRAECLAASEAIS